MHLTKNAFRCKIKKYDIVIMQKSYKTKRHIFMKRTNNKLLTLMLAGVLCAATAGTVAATLPVKASADTTAKSYTLTSIFNTNNTNSAIEAKDGKTALTMGDGQSVEFDRNLAIKWYAQKGVASFTTLKFTFDDVNFTEMTFTFNSASLHAAKDGIAINTVKFVNKEGKVTAQVNDGAAVDTAIVEKSSVTLSLADGSELGNYKVNLTVGDASAVEVGEFTNVGAKYFSTDSMESLVISAKTADGAKTVLFVDEINGQRFDGITDGKVKDTAEPVLVVNDDIRGFLLGAQFELDYKEIDVLDTSLTDTKTFYQYNPTDEKTDYTQKLVPNSTTGTYFMDTVIYADGNGAYSKEAKEGFEQTTLFRAMGAEYVSIKFEIKDDTFTGGDTDTHKAKTYELAWYADDAAVQEFELGTEKTDYIVINRNAVGPVFKAYTAEEKADYDAKLQENADDVYAGSNAKVELPSLSWLIADENNGYQSLQFTISYRTPSSSSAKTSSNLDSDDLEISVDDAGLYEFKVFASDVVNNPMMVEDKDGKLVKVTTANVWDLDSIPSFQFSVAAKGIKADDGEDKDTLDTLLLDETYTMSSIDIVGATSEKSEYALYKLDLSKYTGDTAITTETLSGIKFDALKKAAEDLVKAELEKDGASAANIDYKEINRQAYINLIAKAVGGDAAKVAAIFTEVEAYDDRITEENEEAWAASDNKYKWNPDSRSFKAAESGLYLIVADYWDGEMLFVDHVPAYQLVEVESEVDSIKGETEWLKNNLVSVILFSIAAVMLILIIILLLVKPSDETLEDVDKKVVSKRKEATDKHKKN